MRLAPALLILAASTAHAGEAATLLHVPPSTAEPDTAVELVAAIDGAWREGDLVARYRRRGEAAYADAPFRRSSAGGWYAEIPAEAVGRDGVEYYIAGSSGAGEILHFASPDAPHAVTVVPHPLDQLAGLDRARHGGRADEVSFDVFAHRFGNRFDDSAGLRDQFLRAEARWTHHWFRALYATGFGFGAIEGVTPSASAPDAMELEHEARYGFGEVRLRAHAAAFLDARVALGVSHDGFIGGFGATMILGRPWGTHVALGGEYLGDLGPSGFVRLQWDTAPPLLMSASVVRTDLPGARLADGVLVRYDLAYRVTRTTTARAAISAGARDGLPDLGAGLGAAVEF